MAETARSLELDPDSAEIHNDAGVVHSTTGDFDTAREHYRTALALDSGFAKAALNLAKLKRFTADHDEDEEPHPCRGRTRRHGPEHAARPEPRARQDP